MKKKKQKQFIKTNDFKMCLNFYSLLEKNLVDIDINDNDNNNNNNNINIIK